MSSAMPLTMNLLGQRDWWSAIVQVDPAPFKQWYLTHYGVELGKKKEQLLKKKLRRETLQPRKPRRAIMCKRKSQKAG
ncbi:hypothetical protein ACS0TY_022571 [Phlomoides rotata]